MVSTNRFAGLKLLESLKVPCPSFQTVRHAKDLAELQFPLAKYGWTIRTCRFDGLDEFGLYSRNYLTSDIVLLLLRDLLVKARGEFYIVYPSWVFSLAVNIVADGHSFNVDACWGPPTGISIGKASPRMSLCIPFGFTTYATVYRGQPDAEVMVSIARIIYFSRKFPWGQFYVEAAVTDDERIYFYELRQVHL